MSLVQKQACRKQLSLALTPGTWGPASLACCTWPELLSQGVQNILGSAQSLTHKAIVSGYKPTLRK